LGTQQALALPPITAHRSPSRHIAAHHGTSQPITAHRSKKAPWGAFLLVPAARCKRHALPDHIQ
jgi:hypothetical protein